MVEAAIFRLLFWRRRLLSDAGQSLSFEQRAHQPNSSQVSSPASTGVIPDPWYL